jgi:hypothetical protein
MAIIKSKTLPNGSVGNYYKITSVSLDKEQLTLIINLSLFKDKATSDNELPPLKLHKTLKCSITKEQSTGDLLELGYVKLLQDSNIQISSRLFDPTASRQEQESAPTIAKDPDIADGISD